MMGSARGLSTFHLICLLMQLVVKIPGLGCLLVATTVSHILLAPFTKVEESFNIQAVHDLCFHGFDVSAYDHMKFPGVVPRTFIGALVIAVPSCPLTRSLTWFGFSKLSGLYVARLALAGFSLAGLWYLACTVSSLLGQSTGNAFILLLCSQFHVLFYAGRTLPNTLALPLVAIATAQWLQRQSVAPIVILTFATVVIRCDLAPLLGIIGLQLLGSRQLSLKKALQTGLIALAASLALTVSIDSLFWRRWLWPEGSVLWFNTAENRSSEWGTQPVHWYFTSALPRALTGAIPLLVVGFVVERRVRLSTAVTLLYIGLYSLLPHKELRFLLPVLPLLNVPAAAALSWLWHRKRKSSLWSLSFLAAAALIALSCALTCLFLVVSRLNYPGGHALQALHDLPQAQGLEEVLLHIDVLPAMTGVTRFGELGEAWTYSKDEGLSSTDFQARQYTFLLNSQKTVPGYALVKAVSGFSRLELRAKPKDLLLSLWQWSLPFSIIKMPSVYIQELLAP